MCSGEDAGAVVDHPNVEKPDNSHPFDKSCTQALDILCSNGDLWTRLCSTHPLSQIEPDGKKWVDLWCEENFHYFVNEVDKVIASCIEANKFIVWQKAVEKCYYNGFCVMMYGKAPEEMEDFVQYEEYRTFIEWVDEHGKLATNYTKPSAKLDKQGKRTRERLERQLGLMWMDAKATQGKHLRPCTFLHKLASDPKLRDAHSHGEVVAMLISMWWSGNFSASVGCSNTVYGLYRLSKHDGGEEGSFLEAVRSEVSHATSYSDLAESPNLALAIRESLRWRSPVLGSFRRVKKTPGPELYCKKSEEGHMFMVTPRGCQADKSYWGQDVDSYNPHRWTSEQKQLYPIVSDGPHYFPFGYGKRRCIGAEMAQFFLKTTVSRFISQTEFQMKGRWDQWILFGTSQPLKIQARFVRRGRKLPIVWGEDIPWKLVECAGLGATAFFFGTRQHKRLQSIGTSLVCAAVVPALLMRRVRVAMSAWLIEHVLTAKTVGAGRTSQEVEKDILTKVSGLEVWKGKLTKRAFREVIANYIQDNRHIDAQSSLDKTTRVFLSIAARMVAPPQSVYQIEVPSEPPVKPWQGYGLDKRVHWFDEKLKIGLPKKGEVFKGASMIATGAITHVNSNCGFPELDPQHRCLTDHMHSDAPSYVETVTLGMALLGDKLPLPNIKHGDLAADSTQADLAFHGPGVLYLKPCGEADLGAYVSDTSILRSFQMREGFEQAGAEAFFDKSKRIVAVRTDKGTFKPGDALWEHAKYVWRCSAMTYMTVVQHLCWTHWIISNGFTSSCRSLPPNHPVRRVLKVNCFGTAEININSTTALHPEYGFLHKLSGFEYASLSDVFKAGADMYKFQTWPDFVKDHPLSSEDKDKLPFFQDGLRVWKIMETFYSKYVDIYYEDDAAVQADAHLAEYWKFALVPQYTKGLPPLSKSSLAKQLAHSCFHVTAWHEFVGGLMPYVSSPDGMFYGVRMTDPPQLRASRNHYVATLALTSATGGRMPGFCADWSHLLLDANAFDWHADFKEALKAMPLTDDSKFSDFNPHLWESSVSV